MYTYLHLTNPSVSLKKENSLETSCIFPWLFQVTARVSLTLLYPPPINIDVIIPMTESVTENRHYIRFSPNLDSGMISSLANYRLFFSSFRHIPPQESFVKLAN